MLILPGDFGSVRERFWSFTDRPHRPKFSDPRSLSLSKRPYRKVTSINSVSIGHRASGGEPVEMTLNCTNTLAMTDPTILFLVIYGLSDIEVIQFKGAVIGAFPIPLVTKRNAKRLNNIP